MRPKQLAGWLWLLGAIAAVGIAQAQTAVEHVIHTFGNMPMGANPCGTPVLDGRGNLYGTTYGGGADNLGVVFRLGADGYRVLHRFQGGADGSNPYAGVTLDSAGNLYGTTYNGGTSGQGVVYKVDTSGNETVLYNFAGGADGANPYAGVIVDAAGNLYGTTYQGGTGGKGVVYKVSPSGQETVLYAFTGGADGANPHGGVISDPSGNLYGTTYYGGSFNFGVVYKVDASGRETVLYTFPGASHSLYAGNPEAGVIRDPAGNLYGTSGGLGGVVYKLDTAGNFVVLHQFPLGFGPQNPASALARDSAGNLYGTTYYGGSFNSGVVYKVDAAGHYRTLYSFPGQSTYGLGYYQLANSGVVVDVAGNLYGTTPYAGVGGMVYKVDASGHETTLYGFQGTQGGQRPLAGVIRDAAGNLYGTAANGGPANAGVVYRVDAAGHWTVLYAFTGGLDGAMPETGVVRDSAGNLYGTTVRGGAADAGVVYKIDPSGHETVLYTFTGGADGGFPNDVILDSAGNLYGTTEFGGAGSQTGLQEGVVFKLDPSGHETVLYSFTGLADGGVPTPGSTRDTSGNLYGTTQAGGLGGGVVYKLDAAGRETVLYTFSGAPNGFFPRAGVTPDSAGNLYGTTSGGGGVAGGEAGVVFKLSPAGDYTVLYTFSGGADGGNPVAGVVRDQAGNLYGTTQYGGRAGCVATGCGVVYRVDPAGQETVLHTFTGGSDGGDPYAGVILDAAGNLYGTASAGGANGGGVLCRIAARRN